MRHIRLEQCGSTNDEASGLFDQGETGPFLISTRDQVAGRGRDGRKWSHDPRNFAGSFLLPATDQMRSAPGALSLLAGLAVRDALIAASVDPAALRLKWPNDVLLNHQKVGGILAELVSDRERFGLIIGIGVNLTKPPNEARFPARAVFDAASAPSPQHFGDNLGEQLERWLNRLTEQGTAWVLDAWRATAWRSGEKLTVRSGEHAVSGLFRDIDDQGRLILALPSGQTRVFSAGDASHG